MRTIIAALYILFAPLSAVAQETRSPQELATQVRVLIETKNTDRIVELVHPGADAASIERLKAMLSTYVGAENLKGYLVPKDDKEAVRLS